MARPRGSDSRSRTRALLGFLAAGTPLREAAKLAKVDAGRALTLMQDPQFRKTVDALLDQQAA